MTWEKLGKLELNDKCDLKAESLVQRQLEDNRVAVAEDLEADNHDNTVDKSTS